jgi:DsbC/DsbD-like thiol-disulfide interchange protein
VTALSLRRILLGSLFLTLFGPLWATTAPIPHGTVELIAEHGSIKASSNFTVGLKFQLEKGWHIYWINPGDAGQPPRVTWDLPAGLSAGEIQWPFPKPLPASSLMDFGYEDEVVLLVPMKSDASLKSGGTATLNANLKMIVCHDVCIPGKAAVSLPLSISTAAPTANAATKPLFDEARKKLPQKMPASWKLKLTENEENFRIDAVTGSPVKQAFLFPLEDNQIENAAPQIAGPQKAGFRLILSRSRKMTKRIDRLKGVLVIEGQAYNFDVPVT